MALLALDVGFSACGYTVWEGGKIMAAGVIETEKSEKKMCRMADDYSFRSAQIAQELKNLIGQHSIQGIIGELPSGGAKSAKATCMMNMSTAIVSAVAQVLGLPCEWCSPGDVKRAITGFRAATKEEIMGAVAKKFDIPVIEKRIKCKKNGTRVNLSFRLCGKIFPGGTFEHIADSIGVYMSLNCGNLVKLFG